MINKLLFTALLFIFTLNVFSQVPNYVPTNGLVGYWPFNGNANDESGNGNNGTVNGATLTTDRFGNANSAYSFDGVNDFVDVGNSFFNNGWTNYSISCWIKATNLNTVGGNTIMNTIPHGGFALGYSYYSSNSFYHFKTSSNPGSAWDIFSHEYSNANNLNFNQFHNLTLTKEGLIYKYYVDGVLDKTMSTSIAPLSIFFALKFGAIDGNTENFNGIIDDISIYNRALTPAEINQIYSDQTSTVSTPPCPTLATNLQTGLVGYWPFCGNANDESGNGNNGTVNGATLTTDRFGNANSAYSFDGIDDRIFINNPIFDNGSNFTFSGWYFLNTNINPNNGNNSHIILNTSPHNGLGLAMNWGSSNKYSLSLGSGTPSISWNILFDAQSVQNIEVQSWKFITLVKLSNTYSLYVDGVLDQIWTANNSVQTYLYKLYFGGCDPLNSNEVINGKLDDIGIWNRALTQQEITNLYTSTVPPSVAVLSGDATICAGASTNLSVAVTGGTAPYTVIVTDGTNNYSATGASPVSIAVSPTATSTYSIVSVTGGGTGTGNTGTATVTVIDATITASDSTICAGETTTLSVTQGGSSNTAFAALPTNLQTGLVGYWPFCGNANDESGNGNNGTVNGATLTTDRFGSANSAYSFDGVNDYIQAPDYASNSSFTFSCWVNMSTYNLNSLGSNDFIFFGNHSGINDNNRNFLIGYRNFGSEYGFSTYIFNDNGINTFQSYPTNQTPPTVNSWHHFVSVFENGTYVKMYLDNVLFWTQDSNISLQTTRPSEPLFFGIGIATQYDFLNGKLDDVGFWNRALTATEIQQLFTQEQTTFAWSSGATTATINASPTSTTTYTCTTTTNGVSCTDSVTVVVNNPTIDLGNDVTACGTSTTLTAPTGYDSYLWSNGGTTNTTTVTSNGTYTCTVTQGLCSASDTLEVVLITLNAQASSTSICAGASVELTGSSNLNLNQNSYCIGNTGSPNPWPYPSAFDAGIIDLGNIGAQSVFSISAWVNAGATQNGISILLDASHGGSANWVVQAFGNNTYTWGSLSFTLTPNVWQHVLLTYVNGSKKCYIDGQLVASVNNPISYSGSPQLYLGNWPEGGRRFNGLVDELYITYSELQSSNFVPSQVINAPSANSFGLWHFDEGSNGTAVNSVNGSAAQIGSWFWATRPIVSNATISWNGVPGASVQTVSPQITTTYVSSVTMNSVTCSDSVTVVVNNPTIDLGNDVTACGTSTTLTAPTGYDSYLWSNGGTTNTTTVTSNGTYSCTVTQGGCSATDSIDVVLVPLTINTTNISAAATYTWENNGQTYTSSGIYTGTTVNCETQVLNLTITPSSPTLALQVFLDGYYINSLNPAAMTAARYNNLVASGSTNPGANTDVDVITVELRSPSNLDIVAYSVSPILQTNGSVQCVFPAGALGGSFYIVVKHRAANPLWSANPIILTTSTTYDFANNLVSAYSNGDLSLAPMHTIVSSLYGIWLGELNEDGYLDATDYSNLELDIYASGYLGQYLLDGDLNGDTYVDASDFAVFESNSIYGPYEQRPYAITTNVSIGQSYQGGIVAYILQPGDAGYDANVQHGLIAAPSDQGTAQWGCTWTTAVSGAYGQAIGTGAQNTIDIMNGCSEAGIAARLCGDLILDGYSDWYLPSLDELNKLYLNKVAIGGFAAGNFPISIYWSSTAFNNGNNDAAWGLFFYDGIQYPKAKVDYLSVRAVRAF